MYACYPFIHFIVVSSLLKSTTSFISISPSPSVWDTLHLLQGLKRELLTRYINVHFLFHDYLRNFFYPHNHNIFIVFLSKPELVLAWLLEPHVVILCVVTTTLALLQASCIVVAAILHYLFLSVFCWMLCEGIMLYLMLVLVFSKLSKKWWLFLLIGYGEIVMTL